MKRIAVVTTTRADWGLLKHLARGLSNSADFELFLIASGTHLSPAHGETIQEIYDDNIPLTRTIDIGLIDDSCVGICKSLSLAIEGFSQCFSNVSPDLVLVLGDRYEILGVCSAALLCGVPIAHIHGGEITEGAIDESIRHAITKMSSLHFAAAEPYAKRILQMGEDPAYVYNVGGLGIDGLKFITLIHKNELEREINLKFMSKNAIITFHPETNPIHDSRDQLSALLLALDCFPDICQIFTMPNADEGNLLLREMVIAYCAERPNCFCFESLGQLRFYSCLSLVDVVIGNSSSGILEAPSFRKPTINIGDRQKGRLHASSVINCDPIKEDIVSAILKSYSSSFKAVCERAVNPYGTGGASESIISILKNTDFSRLMRKKFFDYPL